MSQLITTTDISTIRPVFAQGASENIKRYNQLKKLFEKNKEYLVFAEPIPAGGQKIAWHTEFPGTPVPFESLSPAEKETAKGRLKYQVNRLYKGVAKLIQNTNKNTKELFELIDSCIEIPDYKDIYVVKNSNGQNNFCIIRWGFTSDDFKAQTGLVEKLIPLKVDTVTIQALLPDSSIASGESIVLENAGEKFEATTDNDGKIFLEDVEILSEIFAYQIQDGEKIYEHYFVNNQVEPHIFQIGEIEIPPVMQNTTIQATDKSGLPLAGIEMEVKFGDTIITRKTDQNGKIHLGEIEAETQISCSQIVDGKKVRTSNFQVAEGKEVHNFQAQKLITSGQMTIKLEDESGNIIPNSPVKVFYNGKTEELKTDENGNITLKDVQFDSEVKCQQIVDGIAQNQTIFNYEKGKTKYTMRGTLPKPIAKYANIKIQAVNRKDEPIPNQKISVDNGSFASNLVTNNDGEIFVTEINCSKEVIISTEYQGKKTEKRFYCKEDNEFHQLVLGRRKGLFWFWLIPLLLLLLLLGYFFLLPLILNDDNEDNTPIVDTVTVVDTTHVIDTVPIVPEIHKGINIIVLDKENENPVADAEVKLEYNGQTVTLKTNSEGVANFVDVPEDEKLEILAIINSENFTEQRATFMFVKEKTIYMSDESVEVSEVEVPCGETINSNGYGSTIKTVRVNRSKGTVRMIFDTFSIADEVIVYNGKSSEIDDSKIVWKSNGYVKRLHRENFVIDSPDSLITIQINGGDETRTEWYFKVYCN